MTNNPFQPISEVYWIDPAQVRANDYNPNHVFDAEMELLEVSILEDGFTQPAVVRLDEWIAQPPTLQEAYRRAMLDVLALGAFEKELAPTVAKAVAARAEQIIREAAADLTGEIVDGYHRRTLALRSEKVRAMTGGLLPVVFLDQSKSRADRMLSTIRHNRARGQHGIIAMGEIVRELAEQGISTEDIMARCGMEEEEIDRLRELRGSPEQKGRDSFGKGWKPTRERE
ncbi:MAG TPA: ParB N-terminal domain-containing protein [Pyrinomonadaceae bacterium]|jgi:ParB-like chromosome segregation protein Spo0J